LIAPVTGSPFALEPMQFGFEPTLACKLSDFQRSIR
jgi:hypothetical protein